MEDGEILVKRGLLDQQQLTQLRAQQSNGTRSINWPSNAAW